MLWGSEGWSGLAKESAWLKALGEVGGTGQLRPHLSGPQPTPRRQLCPHRGSQGPQDPQAGKDTFPFHRLGNRGPEVGGVGGSGCHAPRGSSVCKSGVLPGWHSHPPHRQPLWGASRRAAQLDPQRVFSKGAQAQAPPSRSPRVVVAVTTRVQRSPSPFHGQGPGRPHEHTGTAS